MHDVIVEYQKWKSQGEDLRAKAKLAMETRFRDLLLDAVKVAEEYRADFGGVLKPPPMVTGFRYKAGKVKKAASTPKPAGAAPKKAEAPVAPVKSVPPPKPDRKIVGLQKRLETAKKRLEAAKAAGAPARDLDDKVYELEDALRVALSAD